MSRNPMRRQLVCCLALFGVILWSCAPIEIPSEEHGLLGQACYENFTCAPGLRCDLSNKTCVVDDEADAMADSGGSDSGNDLIDAQDSAGNDTPGDGGADDMAAPPDDGVAMPDPGPSAEVADTGEEDLCAEVVCVAKDQCHDAGTCDPATGECSDPPKLNWTPCDDGDGCTQVDSCINGSCTGESPVVCEDGRICADGECSKLVFVTSVGNDGNLGGESGATSLCNDLASAAGLSGSYLPWLGDPGGGFFPAQDFTQADVPYTLVDGSVIAQDWDDLVDGALDHVIDLTELGTGPPSVSYGQGSPEGDCGGLQTLVWSNTASDGTLLTENVACEDNWENGYEYPIMGAAGNRASTSEWSDRPNCNLSCNHTAPIYCFEQ